MCSSDCADSELEMDMDTKVYQDALQHGEAVLQLLNENKQQPLCEGIIACGVFFQWDGMGIYRPSVERMVPYSPIQAYNLSNIINE